MTRPSIVTRALTTIRRRPTEQTLGHSLDKIQFPTMRSCAPAVETVGEGPLLKSRRRRCGFPLASQFRLRPFFGVTRMAPLCWRRNWVRDWYVWNWNSFAKTAYYVPLVPMFVAFAIAIMGLPSGESHSQRKVRVILLHRVLLTVWEETIRPGPFDPSSTSLLSCWTNSRLIFEIRNVTLRGQSTSLENSTKAKARTSEKMTLVDDIGGDGSGDNCSVEPRQVHSETHSSDGNKLTLAFERIKLSPPPIQETTDLVQP
ncbi:hypothetical protein CLCR_04249 [Cladophialophora carrionii]|uniref:Uncharacterized protein n=1 Tax=Cladophialophora carrionii TaxID=86049 RepID=A0A1C1CJ34_9EURO|nr:hypothetical protein CLCR_04249 [Cladophialophora carrionii]